MDRLGLITLREELREDCRVFRIAAGSASAHFREGTHGRLEAVAFELARAYNIVEQMCTRIAREFENHLEMDGGWHEFLLRRMTLQVAGIRPALFHGGVKQDLDELRRFRHLVNHAYDLTLREDRIAELLGVLVRLDEQLGGLCESFVQQAAAAQGWNLDECA
jgi:hypothetical protein